MLLYINLNTLGRAKILILRLPIKKRKRLLYLVMVKNLIGAVDIVKVQSIVYQ